MVLEWQKMGITPSGNLKKLLIFPAMVYHWYDFYIISLFISESYSLASGKYYDYLLCIDNSSVAIQILKLFRL